MCVRAALCVARPPHRIPLVVRGDTLVCVRTWMGVPARLSALGPSRPVPSRRVSHRSPPAIHSSFSQPPACQCPTARRTVCTQKRSGSPSLPRLPPTVRRARAGSSALVLPPWRVAHRVPAAIYTASIYPFLPCSFAPLLLCSLVSRYARLYISLFSATGRLASSSSCFPLRLRLVFFFSAGFFLLFFIGSSFSLPVSHTRERTSAGYRARHPSPTSRPLSLSRSLPLFTRRQPFGVFNLPPSHHVPPPPTPRTRPLSPSRARAAHSFRLVRLGSFRSRGGPVPLARSRE